MISSGRTEIDSSRINSVIARCLTDPAFLEQMKRDRCQALAHLELNEETVSAFKSLDLGKVNAFVGFITKVHHNYLWESFPYTRALMKLYGIEIDTFAKYASIHQSMRANRTTRAGRITRFVAFLQSCLDTDNRDNFPGINDILTHERMLWSIECELQDSRSRPATNQNLSNALKETAELRACVPLVRGTLRVGKFARNPNDIMEALAHGDRAIGRIDRRPRTLAYRVDNDTRELHILELDELSALVLTMVDGESTIDCIEKAISATMTAPSVVDLRDFFEEAVNAGVLILRSVDSFP